MLTAVDYGKQKAYEVTVDIKATRIASVVELAGPQPGLTPRDYAIARDVLDADPRIKEALVRRGFAIPDRVSQAMRPHFFAVGHDLTLATASSRLVRVLFSSDQKAVNRFRPPVDGLMAVLDLYARRVHALHDVQGAANVHVPHDVFDPAVRGTRNPGSPVLPVQQQRNFTVVGNSVSWQNWILRFGFNWREGLVLYQVDYDEGGKRRPILYRASLAEVLTAYADPADLLSWMETFDEGAFGLGRLSVAARPGREVPANARTLSVMLPDLGRAGFSDALNDRIYVYERDGGSLIQYHQRDISLNARATELVIGFIAALGNYTYGFNWVFKQDGAFTFEVELAGEILTKFVHAKECSVCDSIVGGAGPDGEKRSYQPTGDDRYGTFVHPNLVGVSHQHWFSLRLDFDIDGARNAVMENNVQRLEMDGSPVDGSKSDRYFTTSHTVFDMARAAKRDTNHHSARTWTVFNPQVRRDRRPTGYTIMPGENTETIFPSGRQKGTPAFTFHHLWVTPYRDGQLFAAGRYPNQATDTYADTLYSYADDEAVYDRDIVVWYSLGETHVPRVEDYPVMSTAKLSVSFQPDGFFARNPALGLGRVSGTP